MARSATSQSTGLPLLSTLYEPPPKHLTSVLGGPDQPIETRALQAQTPQAHPTGPHVGPHQLGRADQAMQEGQTGDAVKKRDDRGTRGAALWVRLPCLPRGARPGALRSSDGGKRAARSRRSQRWWRSSWRRGV